MPPVKRLKTYEKQSEPKLLSTITIRKRNRLKTRRYDQSSLSRSEDEFDKLLHGQIYNQIKIANSFKYNITTSSSESSKPHIKSQISTTKYTPIQINSGTPKSTVELKEIVEKSIVDEPPKITSLDKSINVSLIVEKETKNVTFSSFSFIKIPKIVERSDENSINFHQRLVSSTPYTVDNVKSLTNTVSPIIDKKCDERTPTSTPKLKRRYRRQEQIVLKRSSRILLRKLSEKCNDSSQQLESSPENDGPVKGFSQEELEESVKLSDRLQSSLLQPRISGSFKGFSADDRHESNTYMSELLLIESERSNLSDRSRLIVASDVETSRRKFKEIPSFNSSKQIANDVELSGNQENSVDLVDNCERINLSDTSNRLETELTDNDIKSSTNHQDVVQLEDGCEYGNRSARSRLTTSNKVETNREKSEEIPSFNNSEQIDNDVESSGNHQNSLHLVDNCEMETNRPESKEIASFDNSKQIDNDMKSSTNHQDANLSGRSRLTTSNKVETNRQKSEDDCYIIESSDDGYQKIRAKMSIKPGKSYRRSLMLLIVSDDSTSDTENQPQIQRRLTLRHSQIVPLRSNRRQSLLLNYANLSNVQEEDREEEEEENTSTINVRENSFKTNSISKTPPEPLNKYITAKEIVLKKCQQTQPLPFEECYPDSILNNCHKIGEGVYGEVFLYKKRSGESTVIKIIPIENDLIVNGERQKTFEEVLSEITISLELSQLRNESNNQTTSFVEVQQINCVIGRYPSKLIDLWHLYDEIKQSENDTPEIFQDNQLYIVLELANAGQDAESFVFNNALQALSMFKQVACALAVAENQLKFEHRDLHWGNILIKKIDTRTKINYQLNGHNISISSYGIEVTIIDYTLSRAEFDGVVVFNDLSQDEELFQGIGDYQFEVYRLMQQANRNNWQNFHPQSNLFWLHYVLKKMIDGLRYSSTKTKTHSNNLKTIKDLEEEILNYCSVVDFVEKRIIKKSTKNY